MKFFSHLAMVVAVITCIVWTLAIFLGGFEILYWMITGNFFHFF